MHWGSPMPERHRFLALKTRARCSYVAPTVHIAQPFKIHPLPVRTTATGIKAASRPHATCKSAIKSDTDSVRDKLSCQTLLQDVLERNSLMTLF